MKELNKRYNIPQEILYTVCLAGWNLCRNRLEKFARLKPYYTEAFIDDEMEMVEAAKRLPGLRRNAAALKEARIRLVNATRLAMDNWQLLKLYINSTFEKDIAETMLQSAGDSFYKKAGLCNWSAVRSLINSANTFIAGHLDRLTANGNMPAHFETDFKEAGENCIALSEKFERIKMENEIATQAKIRANDAIYESLIEMLKDGQQIFRKDAAVKKQFIFRYLVSIQRGERLAGLKVYIAGDDKTPMQKVA